MKRCVCERYLFDLTWLILHIDWSSYIIAAFVRYTPVMSSRQLFTDMQQDQCLESDRVCFMEYGDAFNCSNFLDLDWLSSSGNSCEEETYER